MLAYLNKGPIIYVDELYMLSEKWLGRWMDEFG
jgi:hypothetical protein